ncbi:MAG TPA: hypothetical protein VHE35_34875, partial [Kofleriaceae bacterium]|nr:hypothetical protein [Kofleriaceae bacterium]
VLALLGPALGLERLGRAAAAGTALGAAVWAAGFAGWLPRAGLTPPVRRQGAGHAASALTTHLLYGLLAALPIHLANRALARR